MQIQPYLHFEGRCQEAVEFYRDALGAQVTTMFHVRNVPPDKRQHVPGAAALSDDNVIYAQVQIGDSVLHATDTPFEGQTGFAGFSFSLFASDQAQAARLFAALSEGGQVQVPLGPTFFSPCFGMVKDRFSVTWRLDAS